MPELPEVETVRGGLEKILVGSVIAKVELRRKDLRVPIPKSLPRCLQGQKICAIRRRAKYLMIETPEWTLLNHLGMTGSWRVAQKQDEQKHDHFYLYLRDGRRLAFHDPRRFGLIELFPTGADSKSNWLAHLGPEPLHRQEFTPEYLWQKTRGRKVAIKNLIMDQKVVVGVGNIYASEALFRVGVRPSRPAARLTRKEVERLVVAIGEILEEAIVAGGTTIRDYRQASGGSGEFQQKLWVYDRARQPCLRCKTQVRVSTIGGRSSFWCSQCQK